MWILVPVQVKRCNLCIVSLKVREVVEVMIAFLVPFLPAKERQHHSNVWHRLVENIDPLSLFPFIALNSGQFRFISYMTHFIGLNKACP